MSEYKELLNKMKVSELKELIRAYMKDVKITMTGKNKQQLINHLLEHTELIKGEIMTKKIEIDITDILMKNKSKKEQEEYKEFIEHEYGQFTTKEEIRKEKREHKERMKKNYEAYKNKIYSFIKDVIEIEYWKKTTKNEKELLCHYIGDLINEYKDYDLIKKLPKHLINYFFKHCKNSKDEKTLNKLKEILNKK